VAWKYETVFPTRIDTSHVYKSELSNVMFVYHVLTRFLIIKDEYSFTILVSALYVCQNSLCIQQIPIVNEWFETHEIFFSGSAWFFITKIE